MEVKIYLKHFVNNMKMLLFYHLVGEMVKSQIVLPIQKAKYENELYEIKAQN